MSFGRKFTNIPSFKEKTMTQLIMIRHGQSVANEQKRFAGHSDFDLTELGRRQAELAGGYIYKNFKVDAIYASDLKRAYNTAVPTAKLFGLPIIKDTDLREIFAGEWETLEFNEIAERYPDDMSVWRNSFAYARCTGGESISELYDRCCRKILSIAAENDGKSVVIATHATPIRVFEAMARGYGYEYTTNIPFVANASINVFGVEDNKPYVIKSNITEHVEEILTTVKNI